MRSMRLLVLGAMFLWSFLLLTVQDAFSGHIPAHFKDRLITISEYIYNDDFEAAGNLIDSVAHDPEGRPFELLFRSILYQSQMMAAESDSLEDKFFAGLDSLKTNARMMLSAGRDSALAYYFLGHAEAFRSLYDVRSGHTWSAIKRGLSARKAYSKGYELDPAFHDIALGLGSYRYWKSVKTQSINWTLLIKDEKEDGLRLLRLAADSSEISATAAQVALVWTSINDRRYAEALRLAGDLARRFPRGLTFLWALGEAYYKMGDFPMAADIYEGILRRLKKNPGNYYNIVEAEYFLVRCYTKIGTAEARENIKQLTEEIAQMPIPDETRKQQKNKLRKILENLPESPF